MTKGRHPTWQFTANFVLHRRIFQFPRAYKALTRSGSDTPTTRPLHPLHPLPTRYRTTRPLRTSHAPPLSQWREHSIWPASFLWASYRPRLSFQIVSEKKLRTRAGVVGACGTDPFRKASFPYAGSIIQSPPVETAQGCFEAMQSLECIVTCGRFWAFLSGGGGC